MFKLFAVCFLALFAVAFGAAKPAVFAAAPLAFLVSFGLLTFTQEYRAC